MQFNVQSLIRLCAKPVTLGKDRRNKDLIIKQHWRAASEQVWFRPCLPFDGAYHYVVGSNQMLIFPRLMTARLYADQWVVR